jgi:dipeptidyl aminopeptidase/acylaminoacyl peptidase
MVAGWGRDRFASNNLVGQAQYEIRRKRSDMTGTEQVVARSDSVFRLWDWSPDGKLLLYSLDNVRGRDLWAMPLDGDETPVLFLEAFGQQVFGQFSPDGRWIAYASNEDGQFQVYVRPYPATVALWQVSTEGGTQPRWRRDGKELFYRAPDGRLMAATVGAPEGSSGADAAFKHGTPQPLFDSLPPSPNYDFTYEPANNGQRFLVTVPLAGAKTPITVVLNWQAALGR